MYKTWKQDPKSVHVSWDVYFTGMDKKGLTSEQAYQPPPSIQPLAWRGPASTPTTDTSPINVGKGTFIAPGCVLACAGHAVHPEQRTEGIQTSAPITLGNNVWLGANVTVCGGVTIGDGSVIGAGSVVTRDVPAGVIAAGVPCRVLRPIDEHDRMTPLAM